MSTYVLSQSRSIVDEGSNVVILLNTTGLPNGSLVPYEISGTGIDSLDFAGPSPILGNFNIVNGVGRLTLNIAADSRTEGPETLFVTLTGPGRSESISVNIRDTSERPPSEAPAKFFITGSPSTAREGDYVTFTVEAEGVSAGTVIPYRILGIDSADVVGGIVTGTVLLSTKPGSSNRVTGNILIGLLEDFATEGTETIFLTVEPNFPYVSELVNGIVILDESIDTRPRVRLILDKEEVYEGDNVLITASAVNIPDGEVLSWEIIPYESKINIADFSGITSLKGKFPPLKSNIANVVLQIADDFIFEQAEYFYIYSEEYVVSSSPIKILDSGNTLLVSDQTFTGNITLDFLDKAILEVNLGGLTVGKSRWEDDTGKLSSSMVLQGKSVFAGEEGEVLYQPFSYVIRTDRSLQEWEQSVKQVLHPAGLVLFSELNNDTEYDELLSLEIDASSESETAEIFIVTSDSESFRTNSNVYNNSRFSIPLKSDFAYYFHRYL